MQERPESTGRARRNWAPIDACCCSRASWRGRGSAGSKTPGWWRRRKHGPAWPAARAIRRPEAEARRCGGRGTGRTQGNERLQAGRNPGAGSRPAVSSDGCRPRHAIVGHSTNCVNGTLTGPPAIAAVREKLPAAMLPQCSATPSVGCDVVHPQHRRPQRSGRPLARSSRACDAQFIAGTVPVAAVCAKKPPLSR